MGVRRRLAGKKEASKRGRGIREGSVLGEYSQNTAVQCGQKLPERNLTCLELCEPADESISDCEGVGVLRIQNLTTVSLVLSLTPQIAVPWPFLYQT